VARDQETHLRPSPDVVARRLDLTGVLVHLPTNRIFELNETGIRIWELVAEGLEVERIARKVAQEFEVNDERANEEVQTLVSQLRNEGLLES